METEINFNVGDMVKLPHNETGTVIEKLDVLWGFKYKVRIRNSSLHDFGDIVEFRGQDMSYELYRLGSFDPETGSMNLLPAVPDKDHEDNLWSVKKWEQKTEKI